MVYMYEYTWYQWLTFFFIYCFFGWIFESTYGFCENRSLCEPRFSAPSPASPVWNRRRDDAVGIPPVKDNLFLVYLAGVIAATILEYVTGWGWEKLFKMKYWDYSNQRFNVKGYICLSSSIAWGFLTIFLTEVVHRPIEHYVLGLPVMVNIIFVLITSLLFAADTAESVKTALDLAKVLDAMTDMPGRAGRYTGTDGPVKGRDQRARCRGQRGSGCQAQPDEVRSCRPCGCIEG